MPRKKAKAAPPPREPVVVDACRCDCCATELGPGAPQSDGYCPPCARDCFPPASFADGTYTRVVFTRVSREALHAAREQAETQPDPTQQLMQRAAQTFGQIARPHVDRLIRDGVNEIRKLIKM